MVKKEPLRVVCLDTGVLFGLGRKIIRKIKEEANPRRKLREISEDGILATIYDTTDTRFTTIITCYEFVIKMVHTEGVDITLAREVYEKIKEDFQIIELIPDKKWQILSPDLMNQLSKLNISLPDGLHIYIASKFKLPFITTEADKRGNLRGFKKLYSEVYSVKELLERNQ